MTNVFHTYHPAVAFVFLASALALSMACLHPVFTALSLAGALACSCVCRGGRATLLSLRWIVPLCLVVAAANPFFVASGSTELFRIGQRAIYAEALLYGLCSGGMFASVFLWFASYSSCMDSENSLALFGNAAPVVTLMVSQVLRLVPQFVSRGRAIADVQDSMSAAAPRTKKDAAQGRMRIVSVLMGWGMEDALERSCAMRARGYDCGARRTTYARFRLGASDAAVLAAWSPSRLQARCARGWRFLASRFIPWSRASRRFGCIFPMRCSCWCLRRCGCAIGCNGGRANDERTQYRARRGNAWACVRIPCGQRRARV